MCDRHCRQVHLHSHVPAGDHDGVGGLDNRIYLLQRLGLFDLRDDMRAAAGATQQLAQLFDVPGRADKRQRHVVKASIPSVAAIRDPRHIVAILLCQAGSGKLCLGQVDALAAGQHAAEDDAADNLFRRVHFVDFQAYLAVVEEYLLARPDRIDHLAQRGGDSVGLSFDLLAVDFEKVSLRQQDGTADDRADADFWSAQVGYYRHRPGEFLFHGADVAEHPGVLLFRAV